jgi:hypothetical protein
MLQLLQIGWNDPWFQVAAMHMESKRIAPFISADQIRSFSILIITPIIKQDIG